VKKFLEEEKAISPEQSTEPFEKPKKNKVCKNWEIGECKRADCVFLHYYPPCLYGNRCKNPVCKYIHEEKQEKPKFYKTKICRHWMKNGKCRVQDCGFIHDLNDPAIKYCSFGDNCFNEHCRFFHVPKNFKTVPAKTPVKKQEDHKKGKRDPKEIKKTENYKNIFSVLVEAN
jgi:hypothetical protein